MESIVRGIGLLFKCGVIDGKRLIQNFDFQKSPRYLDYFLQSLSPLPSLFLWVILKQKALVANFRSFEGLGSYSLKCSNNSDWRMDHILPTVGSNSA